MIQGSEEWLAARAGLVTASRFKDVLAKGRNGKPSATRQSYLMEIVTERLTGLPVPSYTNNAMQWGHDQESAARAAYECESGMLVDEVALVLYDGFDGAGASPDGLVGDYGGIEIKCPFNSVHHVETLRGGMPNQHIAQIQGCMWVTDRQWWDYISYDPRMPERLQLYVQRIERDREYVDKLREAIAAFVTEAHIAVMELNK